LKGPIRRLNAEGKAEVAFGVFVPAVQLGERRETGETVKRLKHRDGITLEEPPAAACEQGVARKYNRLLGEVVTEAAGRMAWGPNDGEG
jgi:hypothetical protein